MQTSPVEVSLSRRKLGELATDAALELNSLANGSSSKLENVGRLAAQLRGRHEPCQAAKPTALVSLDPGILAALTRAFETTSARTIQDEAELSGMTDTLLQDLELANVNTDKTDAKRLSDFCLMFSSRLSASSMGLTDRRPANPWRRSI